MVRMISMGIDVYGRVLDLEQGRIREIEGCGSSHYTTATFASVSCSMSAMICLRKFMTLWADKVRQAIAKAQARATNCRNSAVRAWGSLELDMQAEWHFT